MRREAGPGRSSWGALICHAAKHYGVRATGVTLADEQFAYAREKVARLGLEDSVTLELRDYALVQGSFDKIASIGMFEQVGIANYPTYFETVNRAAEAGRPVSTSFDRASLDEF